MATSAPMPIRPMRTPSLIPGRSSCTVGSSCCTLFRFRRRRGTACGAGCCSSVSLAAAHKMPGGWLRSGNHTRWPTLMTKTAQGQLLCPCRSLCRVLINTKPRSQSCCEVRLQYSTAWLTGDTWMATDMFVQGRCWFLPRPPPPARTGAPPEHPPSEATPPPQFPSPPRALSLLALPQPLLCSTSSVVPSCMQFRCRSKPLKSLQRHRAGHKHPYQMTC